MNCTQCGLQIGEGQRFCNSCGAPAPRPIYCANCGAEVPAGTRFCVSCGAAQDAARVAGAPMPAQSVADAPQRAYQPQYSQPSVQPQGGGRPFKGVGIRIVAAIVDGIIYFIFAWVFAAATGNTSSSGFELNGAPALFTMAIWLAYYVVLEGLVGGTIGKLVVGIRVANANGQAPGLMPALIRNVLRIVDFLPMFYILGILTIAFSREKQRVGDRVAGTYVVSSSAMGYRLA